MVHMTWTRVKRFADASGPGRSVKIDFADVVAVRRWRKPIRGVHKVDSGPANEPRRRIDEAARAVKDVALRSRRHLHTIEIAVGRQVAEDGPPRPQGARVVGTHRQRRGAALVSTAIWRGVRGRTGTASKARRRGDGQS